MFIDRNVYCEALEASLNTICFDRASGESFSFEKLFYPLELDEGKYAFQSYSEQMEQARNISKNAIVHRPKTVLEKKIFGKIEKLQFELAKKDQDDRIVQAQDEPHTNFENNNNKDVINKRKLSSEIKERIELLRFRQSSERKIDIAFDTEDTLLNESKYDHRSLILSGNLTSRVLIIASAGHGKTTLLRRIALYYCHPLRQTEDHHQLKNRYSLSGKYIPCLIRLRDTANSDFSINKAIENSVIETLSNYYPKSEINDAVQSGVIRDWIGKTEKDFILLIDGLDELSDEMRYDYLLALDYYANTHSETPIILTSRVAGLAQPGVKELLRKLNFHGRSIIPLTDEQAKEYSIKWIKYTQPEEQHSSLFDAVEQILEQKRFKYLKEFMRTPLELLVILKQLVNDTLSLNRYQMFHDMLWELFTNHEKRYDRKHALFDDTMTILSYIAYTMQLNNTLFISSNDLELLKHQLSGLSFHTNVIQTGQIQDYLRFLNDLATNVGIIERDDSSKEYVYTFPIRAYQEYLTAHACCHLRLDVAKSKPEPSEIIKSHFHDSQWLNVFTFMLSDLSANNQVEFDKLIPYFFSEFKELDTLKSIVEADLAITRAHATALCNNVFSEKYIGREKKELLLSCMGTKSAYAYTYALKSLFMENSNGRYLEATAFSSIIWDINTGLSPLKDAEERINSGLENEALLGAAMLSLLIRFVFGEELLSEESDISRKINSEIHFSDTILERLSKYAFKYSEPIFIKALTDIWVSKMEGSSLAKQYLTKKAGDIILTSLEEFASDILKIYTTETGVRQRSEFIEFQNLVYALGSLPILKSLIIHKDTNVFIVALLETLYEESKNDISMDQIAIAVACLYYCWPLDQFLEAWTFDICKGLPYEYVRKDLCRTREQNHFSLIKQSLRASSEKYREIKQKDYNMLSICTNEKSVFSFFKEQDYLGAAQYCLKTMGKLRDSNPVNLAFLMRYGKLSAEKVGRASLSIPELLEDGVNNHDAYAVLNMALYKLQTNDYNGADILLKSLTIDEWEELTNDFWLPELWDRDHDLEGALVCVLANKYIGIKFDDYEIMFQAVKNRYPQLFG